MPSALEQLVWRPVVKPLIFADDYYNFESGDERILLLKSRVAGHSRSTDLSRDIVRLNFRNSQDFFLQASHKSIEQDSILRFLIIPSKERIIYEWALKHDVYVPDEVQQAVRQEIKLTLLYLEFFSAENIPAEDMTTELTDAFTRALTKGRQIYVQTDGHPNSEGYRAYAKAALDLLEQ